MVSALAWELEEAKDPRAVQGVPTDTASSWSLGPNSQHCLSMSPFPAPRRGKARISWEQANARKKKSGVCSLENFFRLRATVSWWHQRQRPPVPGTCAGSVGIPGDLSCGAGAEPVDPAAGTWGAALARGRMQPQNFGMLKRSCGDGTVLPTTPVAAGTTAHRL